MSENEKPQTEAAAVESLEPDLDQPKFAIKDSPGAVFLVIVGLASYVVLLAIQPSIGGDFTEWLYIIPAPLLAWVVGWYLAQKERDYVILEEFDFKANKSKEYEVPLNIFLKMEVKPGTGAFNPILTAGGKSKYLVRSIDWPKMKINLGYVFTSECDPYFLMLAKENHDAWAKKGHDDALKVVELSDERYWRDFNVGPKVIKAHQKIVDSATIGALKDPEEPDKTTAIEARK